jgi:hypothetical protein
MQIVDPEGVAQCLAALRECFNDYGYQQFWDAVCGRLEPEVATAMANWNPDEEDSDEGDAEDIPTSSGYDLVDWASANLDNPKAWPLLGKFLAELMAHVQARQARAPRDLQAPKAAKAIKATMEDLKTCVRA